MKVSVLLKPQNLAFRAGAPASFSLFVFCGFLFLLSGNLSAQDPAASLPTTTPDVPAAQTFSFSPLAPEKQFRHYLRGAYRPLAAWRSFSVAGTNTKRESSAQDPPAGSPNNGPTVPVTPPPSFSPLTPQGKFDYYLRKTYGPLAIGRSLSLAGINQWRDDPTEWGQGMEGYGRRFASKFAHHSIRRTIQYGAGIWLHEDPRYFPSQRTGFWPRASYAVAHGFITRKDDGGNRLAYSRLMGVFGGALISRTWHPEESRTVKNGLTNGLISLGWDVGNKIFEEFWPDIRRRLRH
jgi:hypothetical protein